MKNQNSDRNPTDLAAGKGSPQRTIDLTKNFTSFQVARMRRYVTTFSWLFAQQYAHAPLLLAKSIFLGVFGRFGNILALVVTVKCAILMLSPTGPRQRLAEAFDGFGGDITVAAIILGIPLLLMLLVAQADTVHNRATMVLRSQVAHTLALSAIIQQLLPLKEKPLSAQQAQEHGRLTAWRFTHTYGMLKRVQAPFIQLIVATFTVLLTFFLGLFLDAMVMSIMVALGAVLLAAFIWRRHSRVHNLSQQQQQFQASASTNRTTFAAAVQAWLQSRETDDALEAASERYHQGLHGAEQNAREFRIESNKLTTIGQGVLFTVFLVVLYTRGIEGDTSHIATAALTVYLLRLMIGQFQTIANNAVALAQDYPPLVELSQSALTSRHPIVSDNNELLADQA